MKAEICCKKGRRVYAGRNRQCEKVYTSRWCGCEVGKAAKAADEQATNDQRYATVGDLRKFFAEFEAARKTDYAAVRILIDEALNEQEATLHKNSKDPR